MKAACSTSPSSMSSSVSVTSIATQTEYDYQESESFDDSDSGTIITIQLAMKLKCGNGMNLSKKRSLFLLLLLILITPCGQTVGPQSCTVEESYYSKISAVTTRNGTNAFTSNPIHVTFNTCMLPDEGVSPHTIVNTALISHLR